MKFGGTLIEGPDLDLLEFSGLELSEDDEERLWGDTNPRDLLMECPSVEEVELEEIDDQPGLSDSEYEYVVRDEEKFRKELRAVIQKRLKR